MKNKYLLFWLPFSFIGICADTSGGDRRETSAIKTTLVTSNASENVRKVYRFLRENYGTKIVSGMMASNYRHSSWNINESETVSDTSYVGKFPAMNFFDYIDISNTGTTLYNDIGVVQNWWNANGIVGCLWHWRVPVVIGSTGDRTSSNNAFYSLSGSNKPMTDFDINRAVVAGTWEYDIVMEDMQKVADALLLLKNSTVGNGSIPVLWRPFHEASGGWFWWGRTGSSDAFKKLWKMMFDLFVYEKGLNNLIWVWTSETGDWDWYPGDEYVDIIGRDTYGNVNDARLSTVQSDFAVLQAKFPDKMVALTEFGQIANLSQWGEATWYSYVAPWCPTGVYAPAAWWKDAAATKDKNGEALLLFRPDMPDWMTYSAD
jgi:mannan endo-1,4-beta-mannosidase